MIETKYQKMFWEVTVLKNPEGLYFWIAESVDPKCNCPCIMNMSGAVKNKKSATRNWENYAKKNCLEKYDYLDGEC